MGTIIAKTGNFSDEELIWIVKKNLDDLGIAYEEGPGDWEDVFRLDPSIFDTDHLLEGRAAGS